jgi:hypothetical protein
MALVGLRFPAYSNGDVGQLAAWAESYLLELLTLYSIVKTTSFGHLQNTVG